MLASIRTTRKKYNIYLIRCYYCQAHVHLHFLPDHFKKFHKGKVRLLSAQVTVDEYRKQLEQFNAECRPIPPQ